MIQFNEEGEPVIVGVLTGEGEYTSDGIATVFARVAAFRDFLPAIGVSWTDRLISVQRAEQTPFSSDETPDQVVAPSPEPARRLSTFAIVFISIASVAVVGLVIGGVVAMCRRRNQDQFV